MPKLHTRGADGCRGFLLDDVIAVLGHGRGQHRLGPRESVDGQLDVEFPCPTRHHVKVVNPTGEPEVHRERLRSPNPKVVWERGEIVLNLFSGHEIVDEEVERLVLGILEFSKNTEFVVSLLRGFDESPEVPGVPPPCAQRAVFELFGGGFVAQQGCQIRELVTLEGKSVTPVRGDDK